MSSKNSASAVRGLRLANLGRVTLQDFHFHRWDCAGDCADDCEDDCADDCAEIVQ